MKKTLVALAVTAFAASASAVTVYENEGSKFEVDGRVNVAVAKETSKVGNAPSEGHSALSNNGSRIRFTATHAVNDDLSAFGRVELRFDAQNKNALVYDPQATDPAKAYTLNTSSETGSAGWGGVRTHRAFVGLKSKSLGSQVTFGKQLLIGDDIGRIGLDNYFGVGSAFKPVGGESVLIEAANSGVEYRFTGVQGLTVGANYSFADTHDEIGSKKAGYGVGAVYEFAVAEGQNLSASLGYSHSDFQYETAGNKKDKDGIYGGVAYETSLFKVGVDGGVATTKNRDGKKSNVTSFVRTGAKFNVADSVAVYGNYGYLTVKDIADQKSRAHRFMLGTEYQLHKHVKTYLEGKLDRVTFANNTKQKDKGVAAGLVVFW